MSEQFASLTIKCLSTDLFTWKREEPFFFVYFKIIKKKCVSFEFVGFLKIFMIRKIFFIFSKTTTKYLKYSKAGLN